MHFSKLVAAVTVFGAGATADLRGQVTFVDLAPATGTGLGSFGRGAAMVDVDGDGLLDIIAANDSMRNFFFRQSPDHSFESASDAWGIAPDDRQHWGTW